MKAIDRLYLYLEYKGIKPSNFEKQVGFSSGYLSKQKSRNADMGEGALNVVLDNCPDLNDKWFIRGKGEMLLGDQTYIDIDQVPDNSKELASLYRECNDKGNRIIELLEENARLKEERR